MASRYDVTNEPTSEAVAANYAEVMKNIAGAAEGRQINLVAVSKTKSAACVKHLYDCGHRTFGENYVDELSEKSKELPGDIIWHFVGHLQSNKVKELLSETPSLSVIESVDSVKLANKLDAGCEAYRPGLPPLGVYLQVNTSGEESKSGTAPGTDTVALALHIATNCKNLRLQGAMTIGMLDYTSRPENFTCLIKCREEIGKALGIDPETLQLSMGMSGDYVNAIKMGSTTVRVGTSLFGSRYYPPKDELR